MQVAAACITTVRMIMRRSVMMIVLFMGLMRMRMMLMFTTSKRCAYDMPINQQQAKRDHHEIRAKL